MTQETMSSKEKRLMEAARLRYMEDCSNKEIADRLGLSTGTVENYFHEEDMQQFKRFYSDQELFKLQQSLESEVRDGYQLANNLLAKAIQDEDAEPHHKLKAAQEAQKIRKRQVKLLQELGVIDKPKERKEVESSADTEELRSELAEGLEQLAQQNEGEEAEKGESVAAE